MRSLYSVCAVLKATSARCGVRLLVAVLGFTALPALADWQDPLQTPAMATTKAHKNLLLDITNAGDRLVAVGERGHVIASDDDGFSWLQAKVPVISTLTAVYFVDENTGWAVGHDGVVIKSVDGGLSWKKQFDGFKANEMVLEQAKARKAQREDELNTAKVMGNPRRIEEAEENLETATFALEDAQYDYEDRSTKPLLDVWFKDAKQGYVIGAYGMIFKTRDGGETWTDWSSHVENPNRYHLNAIAYIDEGKMMIAGEAGLLLRTSDDGEQWEQMFSPYEGSFFGITNLESQNVQVAYGLRGNVARTDTFGSNWKLVDSGTEQTLMGATDRRGRVVYIVGNGGAFIKGIDLGRKWESSIREGRTGAASIIQSAAGHFVVVGENGVELLSTLGEPLPEQVKSIGG